MGTAKRFSGGGSGKLLRTQNVSGANFAATLSELKSAEVSGEESYKSALTQSREDTAQAKLRAAEILQKASEDGESRRKEILAKSAGEVGLKASKLKDDAQAQADRILKTKIPSNLVDELVKFIVSQNV